MSSDSHPSEAKKSPYREQGYYWRESLDAAFDAINHELPDLTSQEWDEVSEALDESVALASDFSAPVPSQRELDEMNFRPEREAYQQRIAELERQVTAYDREIVRVHGGVSTEVNRYGQVMINDR